MHIAIVTRQIGHYHRVRFEASAKRVDRLTIIALTNEGKFREFVGADPASCAVVRLYADRAAYLVAGGRSIRRAVSAALESTLPDVVAISGWASAESFAGIEWARSRQKRVVVMSDSQATDSARRLWREYIKTRLLQYCDAGLVAGRRHRDYIVQLGLPVERVMLGFDVVDNEHFERGAADARGRRAAERNRLGLPERYILASGRFIAKKNFPTLISAFASACAESTPSPHLVILGDGEQRSAIEEAIHSEKVTHHTHLVGFQGYEDLPSYYGLAEAFIHIPRTEQWGLVVNEAAAAGLPLIVSRSCGCSAELVIDAENGYLADAFDVSSVAAAMRRMFALTAEARAAMGAKSQQIVSEWGPDRFAHGLAAAAEAAQKAPDRRVALCDALAMSLLARRPIETVS